jgi:hypothetical protein
MHPRHHCAESASRNRERRRCDARRPFALTLRARRNCHRCVRMGNVVDGALALTLALSRSNCRNARLATSCAGKSHGSPGCGIVGTLIGSAAMSALGFAPQATGSCMLAAAITLGVAIPALICALARVGTALYVGCHARTWRLRCNLTMDCLQAPRDSFLDGQRVSLRWYDLSRAACGSADRCYGRGLSRAGLLCPKGALDVVDVLRFPVVPQWTWNNSGRSASL